MPRRRFLGGGFVSIWLALAHHAPVQGQPRRYAPLARPVVIPLASLEAPGRAWRFVAQGVSPPTAAIPDRPIRVNGLAVRVAAGASIESFEAVCAVCPHEQCEVDLVADPASLDPLVVAEVGPVSSSVYLCPCHNSVFATDDGRHLGGPAPRGLFRFRVTEVTDAAVVIGEVEQDVLLFFA